MVQIATMILSATLAITMTTTAATATMHCAANVAGGSVHYVKDGAGEDRCFALITPENTTKPMPVLMWFHGAGGNAGHCGAGRRDDDGNSLGDLANRHGFALVCGEAKQYDSGHMHGGQWEIPEIVNDTTGNRCEPADSFDIGYIRNIVAVLKNGTKPGPAPPTPPPSPGPSPGPSPDKPTAKCLAAAKKECSGADGEGKGSACAACMQEHEWGPMAKACMPFPFNRLVEDYCYDVDDEDETPAAASPYDVSRLFFSGCSMGSAMSEWTGLCTHLADAAVVSAFATHSTGLKIKGDGNKFPPDNYNPEFSWGECPECKYFPLKPVAVPGLKACIFDDTGDPSTSNPYFFRSSEQLYQNWTAIAGNRASKKYGTGGHCDIHSFTDIVTCLDDGTGRLLGGGDEQAPKPPRVAAAAAAVPRRRAWAPTPQPAPGPPVDTECGPVRGAVASPPGVTKFLSIPYAHLPRRWTRPVALPQAARCWNGTLNATRYAPVCIPALPPVVGAEDCLALSVWRPGNATPAARAPVMVYFHGGDLTTGEARTDFGLLAARGVVVVDVAYRLHVLGFLASDALPESGNLGFVDMQSALGWVQRNIARHDSAQRTFVD